MKSHIRHYKLLLLAIVASLLCACEHKPLYLREGDEGVEFSPVKVSFDWSQLEDPTEMPKGVTLYAYSSKYGGRRTYLLESDKVTEIDLPIGVNMLLFAGNSNTMVELEDISSYANCRTVLATEGDINILAPFYGGTESITVEQEIEAQELVLTPRCKTKHVEMTIKNSDLIADAPKIIVSMKGLANSANFQSGAVSAKATPVTMDSRGTCTAPAKDVYAEIRCLGVQSNAAPHKIIVAAYWLDGRIKAYGFESQYIEDKANTLTEKHRVSLELDFLDAEEIFVESPDFPSHKNSTNTTVDSFEEEEIEIVA